MEVEDIIVDIPTIVVVVMMKITSTSTVVVEVMIVVTRIVIVDVEREWNGVAVFLSFLFPHRHSFVIVG